MNEEMKTALLECCERNVKILSPDVVAFIKDLTNTAIKTSKTKLDDMALPIINQAFETLDEFLLTLADKIDGVEGN